MIIRKFSIGLALAAMSLSACSQPTVADKCADAKNPAECAQYASAGGDVNDYLLYGMVGYMIGRGSGGNTYIYRDPSYRGSYPARMRAPIGSQTEQVKKLERKVAAQKVELRRQQAANARKSQELRAAKSSALRSTPTYSRPSSSYSRPATSSYRSSGSSFRSSSSFSRR